MLLMTLCLLVLLFSRDIAFSHASASPRPDLSGSPSSARLDPIRLNQTTRGTGLGYNSSLSQHTSGTNILPTITSQMNFSSTDHQRSYHMADKVCGSQTQEVVIWDDNDSLYNNFFNFTNLCALWDSSCPGNETLARGMCIMVFILSRPSAIYNHIHARVLLRVLQSDREAK